MDTFWLYVLGVVIFVVGLAISIGLHEIGHLVPAKIFGVRVAQYMIGFGPTLFSKKVGETEYGVKAIPLGGYISMAGMFPPGDEPVESPNKVRRLFGKLVQDARQASDESMVDVDTSRAFYHLPVWKRIIIMVGGPFMNLVLAFVLFAILIVGIGQPAASTTIGSVTQCVTAEGVPANCSDTTVEGPGVTGGLLAGDTIVSINGEKVSTWNDGTDTIRASAGKPLTIVVDRDGVNKTLTITPVLATRSQVDADGNPVLDASGNPINQEVGFIGIAPTYKMTPQPITEVFPVMGQNISGVTNMILHLPQRMVDVSNAAFGEGKRDANGPIGIVGVGRVAGEIASTNQVDAVSKGATLIGILASLNIALFVFNMVPLLPLDGGHIAGALYEAARRQVAKWRKRPDPGPFDTAKLMPLTLVVIVLLGSMSALLLYADIFKPVSIFG
ncbi:MAG: site-2 protease family protein [Actinomycetales bacterium]|nr:site-2 protease family protein [Actinomycetales bacterium]